MRSIACSLVVFSGALLMATGAYVNSMPGGRIRTTVGGWGLAVIAIGLTLLVIDIYRLFPPKPSRHGPTRHEPPRHGPPTGH
ncbi:hypothetical protein Mal64_05620 [Pseudobythopirellula maris]|uniref:Uncharacterized protein n=1 Tax=Pseudobythopirellula maris TaxID=2527991 RepID=A0A5C5ZSY9_9BACT|nr:hypothetical protein [Pseudobythopirellula maris]TWT90178.1 hypothetical protein Mal64_05620 [Pseudobythopirellula maris]